MKILFLLLILFSYSLNAMDMETGSIFLQIKKNKPTLDPIYAAQLSRIIKKMTNKYDISSQLFTAILMQESKYTLEAARCKNAINYVIKNRKNTCTDFGISQINHRTISSYKFDVHKLTSDLSYSVEAGVIVLSEFKKHHYREKEWYTRYNCGNKGSTKRETCQIYKKMISKYL
jgi:hypothetical protein